MVSVLYCLPSVQAGHVNVSEASTYTKFGQFSGLTQVFEDWSMICPAVTCLIAKKVNLIRSLATDDFVVTLILNGAWSAFTIKAS